MRFLIPLVIFVSILISIDFYTFRGIQLLTFDLEPNYRNGIYWAYWLTQIGLIGSLLLFVSNFIITKKMSYGVAFFLFGGITLFYVPKLVFLIFQFIGDISYAGYTGLVASGTVDSVISARFEILTKIGAFIALIPFTTILYGIIKGKFKFTIFKEIISFPDLPESFHGFRIVQLSDFHIGSFRNNFEKVSKGLKMVETLRPDIIVFTGDMVNHKSEEIYGWEKYLTKLKAPYGKYSILGNHDYGDYIQWQNKTEKIQNLENLIKLQAEMGFTLLLNESVLIERGSDKLQLVGVENWGSGGFGKYGDLKKALQNKNEAFKILLSHDPSHWETEVKNKSTIQLTLSGHTHGMQFGIESFGIKWSPIKYRYSKWAGLYKENGQFLYVNRGFGYLGFPGRVGIKPEITLIELRKT